MYSLLNSTKRQRDHANMTNEITEINFLIDFERSIKNFLCWKNNIQLFFVLLLLLDKFSLLARVQI